MKNIISKCIHEPQSVNVKVSCVLTWKIDGQKNIFIADDMDKNMREITTQKLATSYINGFNGYLISMTQDQAIRLIKYLFSVRPLYNKDGISQQLSIPDENTIHGIVNVDISEIVIKIEDGEKTDCYKVAYPNSEKYTKIDLNQYL